MRVFLYEFVTGGGFLSLGDERPPESLLNEGRAMVCALAADLAAAGAQVDLLADARLAPFVSPGARFRRVATAQQAHAALSELAAAADWTVLVAPEFDGHLLTCARRVIAAGGRLLGPDVATIALAADKHATALHLARAGIAVPHGVALRPGEPLPAGFPYPAVLKRRDGAGSLEMTLVSGPAAHPPRHAARLESYYPGIPASVGVLGGAERPLVLEPCWQCLAENFAYRGGRLPLEPALAARARRLAERVAAALQVTRGYFGIDLVLHDDRAASSAAAVAGEPALGGAVDRVIEVNPRLTMLYVGLRALARGNLAAAMLRLAEGEQVELFWHPGPVQFGASGRLGPPPECAAGTS